MSPSEFDLRAALRDGEGDRTPDVDAVIARAGGIARRRRTVFLTASAAAVVVAIGGGGLALRDSGNHRSTTASADHRTAEFSQNVAAGADPPVSATHGAAAPSAASSEVPAVGGAMSPSVCPTAPKNYLLPGGGGTGQFGGTGPLFAKPVSKLIVCGYQKSAVSARELDGAEATALAQSMESASTTSSRSGTTTCPADSAPSLDIIATAADGSRLPDVTVAATCQGAKVTNGTAVRYDWDVPDWMQATTLPAVELPSDTPSTPMMSGSPVH